MAEVSLGARNVLVHGEILCAGDGLYDLVIQEVHRTDALLVRVIENFVVARHRAAGRRGTKSPARQNMSIASRRGERAPSQI
jgi:hypothetical protein